MCGKYHITTEDENLSFQEAVRQMMLEHPELSVQLGDVVPSQIAPVYTREGQAPMRFGFKPHFMKRLLINARSETAHTSPMFAPLLQKSRILVPARAFYEWSDQKVPHLFGRPNGGMIHMAALAFPAEPVPHFVILTRAAVGKPGAVHPRMPVMFESLELQDAWLHQDNLAQPLLQIADEEEYINLLAG
ncbi:MAG: SOS response-associated peptidase [Clostridiales bacterium]|nr:SOS response-associated peptidase [Clostridiales bacterium]